ncbi:MAG: hypothetical protein N4A68_19350 [Maledivibacter sp.]|jgi:hypothetical protein|nr:hypothetical protein [Maledivibacter sp.]
MEVMFYVTIVLLGAIIFSGVGYLIHYCINNRASPKMDEDKKI